MRAFSCLIGLLFLPGILVAQEDVIDNAMSAAPLSVSAKARIVDWEFNELRAGENEWTCLPDRPDSPGNDPWCVTDPWLNFLNAYVSKTEPTFEEIGFAYMLMGDTPVSNSDPYATEMTTPDDWVSHVGAHVMIIIPGQVGYDKVSHDHRNGGPWIMWPNTPYAHIMLPVDDQHMMQEEVD